MLPSVPPRAPAVATQVEGDAITPTAAARRAGLLAYNRQHAPMPDFVPLVLAAHDETGALVGGVAGDTGWGDTGRGWFHVDTLWVAEAWRGRGLGRRLLRAAEAEAARRGCCYAYLDTLDFQARPFYEREGYAVFGTVEDLPPGFRQFYMRKDLAPPAP
jgi:GNAT superfamily N-acetyltransferase